MRHNYLREIAGRDNRVVRAKDFSAKAAGTQLRRLSASGALLRVAPGYFALVPEANRRPGTGWVPSIEATALGIAVADYGVDKVALLGPSAARLHGCYPRGIAVAVVAVPSQRAEKKTVSGLIKFVVRDVAKLDLVRADTELAAGWMTSVEQTLLDLSDDWPRWPVSDSTRQEMLQMLGRQVSIDVLDQVASAGRGRAALERVRSFVDDFS